MVRRHTSPESEPMPTKTATRPAAANAFPELRPKESFQDLILTLQRFWGAQGCVAVE